MSSTPRRRWSARWRSCPACLLSALVLAAPATAKESIGASAQATVEQIAAFGPRRAGSAGERQTARLVERRFRSLGYETAIQTFGLPKGGASRNVVARTPGPLRAIVVAHLDGVSAGPAANDNGSGIAVLLELARVLRNEEGVLLAALGAEERVETGSRLHLGSAHLVDSLSARARRTVRIALSLDMVGYGPSLNVRGLEPSPNASARFALEAARRLGLPATYLQDSGLSDHAEFTRDGLPAAWIQWRWDPCWHTACDTADRVKPWKLGAAARLALAALRSVGPDDDVG